MASENASGASWETYGHSAQAASASSVPFRRKDRLENRLHQLVCEGRLGLASAQRQEATNWIKAYKKYVSTSAN
jgi:hypothetical protein